MHGQAVPFTEDGLSVAGFAGRARGRVRRTCKESLSLPRNAVDGRFGKREIATGIMTHSKAGRFFRRAALQVDGSHGTPISVSGNVALRV